MEEELWGLDVNTPNDLPKTLKSAKVEGFNFICAPLFHPRFKREFRKHNINNNGSSAKPDFILQSSEWRTFIAGKISPYLTPDFASSCDQSQETLEQEINYGNYLSLPAIIIPLRSSKCCNLARIINLHLFGNNPFQIWIKVPLVGHSKEALRWRSDLGSIENKDEYTWEWWNTFWTLCNYNKRLGVMLEVSRAVPSQEELNRWIGEPLRCISISTSIFITNKKGYPVLPKAHQSFIKSLVHLNIQVVITGNNHHDSYGSYLKYMKYLWQEGEKELTVDNDLPVNSIVHPLQPLTENLVSSTYSLFETDSVKYKEYTKAVYCALVDKFPLGNDICDNIIRIMIVGAGRGPLIAATFEAAEMAKIKVKVYAVEKNPFAVLTLESLKEKVWKDSVEIIPKDVRKFSFTPKIDILVSELLGSFGDNELSPEVLDSAQKFLKKGGISIPGSYTSFISPIHGSNIYGDLKETCEKADCEVPYVVEQNNKYDISKPKPLFTFHHPNYCESIDNSRYKTLSYNVEQNCVLHGFTGFFEAVLYGQIKLSIVPQTRTPKLSSWNPIFFPLLEPVCLNAGDEIRLHFWRLTDPFKVWYEWTITKPIPLPIHNPNGRSSKMNLT